MPWVFVVSAAGVWFPRVIAPVAPGALLARQPQVRLFSVARDQHCALVLILGDKVDGIVPDARPPVAVALGLGWPEEDDEQQRGGPDPHGVGWMLTVELPELTLSLTFYCQSRTRKSRPGKRDFLGGEEELPL